MPYVLRTYLTEVYWDALAPLQELGEEFQKGLQIRPAARVTRGQPKVLRRSTRKHLDINRRTSQ
jgi:hypothetical protein